MGKEGGDGTDAGEERGLGASEGKRVKEKGMQNGGGGRERGEAGPFSASPKSTTKIFQVFLSRWLLIIQLRRTITTTEDV